jgi:hypothetical protein
MGAARGDPVLWASTNSWIEPNRTVPAWRRTATSSNPAPISRSPNASSSWRANGARMVAPVAGPMERSRASARAANPGLCSIERQTIAARRPPGTSTRAILPRAAGRSGKYWRPSWQATTSMLASANGRRSVLAWTQAIGAARAGRAEATASMRGLSPGRPRGRWSRPGPRPAGPRPRCRRRCPGPARPGTGAARSRTRGPRGRRRPGRAGAGRPRQRCRSPATVRRPCRLPPSNEEAAGGPSRCRRGP